MSADNKERLTWQQIVEKYPHQWVGLTDVEWDSTNSEVIKTAIIKYADLSKDELRWNQIAEKEDIFSISTDSVDGSISAFLVRENKNLERLTWDKIEKLYPNQAVGLVDIERSSDKGSRIKTAIVKYSSNDFEDILIIQIKTKGKVIAESTVKNQGIFIPTMIPSDELLEALIRSAAEEDT